MANYMPAVIPEQIVISASELCLAPGEWPPILVVDGTCFLKHQAAYHAGELAAMLYVADKKVLTVLR